MRDKGRSERKEISKFDKKQDILSENPDYLESVTSSVIRTVLIITLFSKLR